MLLLARLSGSLVAGEKALFKGGGKQRQHDNETCTADQRGGNHKTQVRIQGRLLTRGNPGPPPVAQKQRRCGGTMSVQNAPSQRNLQPCLTGRALRQAAAAPSVFGGYRWIGVAPATSKAFRNYSNSSRKGSAS